MTKPRPTCKKKSALRFKNYFDALLDQLNSPERPQGMFISCEDAGGLAPATLMNRLSDSLLWLRTHPLENNKYKPFDYERLFASMKKKQEPLGIRIYLMSTSPEVVLRPATAPENPADWKDKVTQFIESDNLVGRFENCIFDESSLYWLKQLCTTVDAQYIVNGDKLTVLKNV